MVILALDPNYRSRSSPSFNLLMSERMGHRKTRSRNSHSEARAEEERNEEMSDENGSSGDGCGCFGSFGGIFSTGGVLAFIISWKLWHALWWALLAAFFGW